MRSSMHTRSDSGLRSTLDCKTKRDECSNVLTDCQELYPLLCLSFGGSFLCVATFIGVCQVYTAHLL